MKVALYVRASPDEERRAEYYTDQLKELRAYAASLGDTVVKEYIDKSDGQNVHRKEIVRLLWDSTTEDFNKVLVTTPDRICTTMEEYGYIWTILNFRGVLLQSKANPYRFWALKASVPLPDNIRDLRKEQIRHGIDKALMDGRTLNRTPFGYMNYRGRLITDEEEAKIVRGIFRDKVRGMGLRLLSKKYGLPIATIGYILKNKTYIGEVVRNGRTIGRCPAIIDKETFDRANGNEEELPAQGNGPTLTSAP